MINRNRIVNTFCELVKIDSPSGEEEEAAVDALRRLKVLGLNVWRDDYGNVIASDDGRDPLLMSAHLDTVEPGKGIKPQIHKDRITSDGTTILGGDCKAGVAAILEALEALKEDGIDRRPVQVIFTREEETGLHGARNLDLSKITGEEAIVFDGEGPVNQITSASPTYFGFELSVTGRAAHAGVEPENGLSAIRIASDMITRLPQGRLDEETTFNVGTIEGGSTRNTVPEKALVVGEFRSRNAETLDEIRMQISQAVEDTRHLFPGAEINHKLIQEFEGYTLTDDDPATIRVKDALRRLGMEPTLRPSGGGTDGNVFRQHGISAVVVGMADHNMHTVREYVTIPELVDAAHLCETLLSA